MRKIYKILKIEQIPKCNKTITINKIHKMQNKSINHKINKIQTITKIAKIVASHNKKKNNA